MEFYYSKGVALIQVLEGEHISVEVFPDNQSTESFEKGEFDNIFKIQTWKDMSIADYELNLPIDMSESEKQELLSAVQKYARSI